MASPATPPMGWNSWESFCLRIEESVIRSMADALVAGGTKDVGYRYVVVDAGWKAKRRNSVNTLAVDTAKFPPA
jgi:alpha-galactosidase